MRKRVRILPMLLAVLFLLSGCTKITDMERDTKYNERLSKASQKAAVYLYEGIEGGAKDWSALEGEYEKNIRAMWDEVQRRDGMVGRLVIPDADINIALFASKHEQTAPPSKDAASFVWCLYYSGGKYMAIADSEEDLSTLLDLENTDSLQAYILWIVYDEYSLSTELEKLTLSWQERVSETPEGQLYRSNGDEISGMNGIGSGYVLFTRHASDGKYTIWGFESQFDEENDEELKMYQF